MVLEALLQIAADCFLNRFFCFAAYHLRHGQSADCFEVRPSPVRWKGRELPPFPAVIKVPCFMDARPPLSMVALTVYFLGGRTMATGEPLAVAIFWPGILSCFACCPLGLDFGDILK